MQEIALIIFWTVAAGSSIPLGGLFASREKNFPKWLDKEFRHAMIALGGGILLGAVALVLIPEGIETLHGSHLCIPLFFLGGVVFFLIERAMGLRQREAPQLLGMLLDYIPEAMALGGLLAVGSETAPLLALLIGLQNLPEGFNTYRELARLNENKPRRTLQQMSAMVLLGPAAGVAGYLCLGQHPEVLGAIMVFASGGILYLLFQDIAPQSRLEKHWAPPLGAVIGFGIALTGYMLLG